MTVSMVWEQQVVVLGVGVLALAAAGVWVWDKKKKERDARNDVREFIAFADVDVGGNGMGVVAVDCVCSKAGSSISHHRTADGKKEQGLEGDTSTALVLDARKKRIKILEKAKFVTCNHFDIDGFLSVLGATKPDSFIEEHETIMREAARIGDFRELNFEKLVDGNPSVIRSLQLCCLLNTLEKAAFARPFEDGSDPLKWTFFFSQTPKVLDIFEGRGTLHRSIWEKEYLKIVEGCRSISSVKRFHDVGLVVVRAPKPLHYYSLFSVVKEADVVLSLYDNQMYEVEQRYSTFVELTSRPVFPRISMKNLAKELTRKTKQTWNANEFTDSGPLLRIENESRNLSKAERYGNPFERPIYPCKALSPDDMVKIVSSYFRFAYGQLGINEPSPARDLSWATLHEMNKKIEWSRFAV